MGDTKGYLKRAMSNDPTSTLIIETTILPEQFFPDPPVANIGERRLMYAVLSDGISCYQKYKNQQGRREQRLFREAETWILSNDCSWFYAFENICDAFDYDAEAVRKELMESRLPQKKRPRHTVGRRVKLL